MKIILFATAFLTALISGLFYAYACSVNMGLGRLSDAEYLKAMQSINRAILNPWFFVSFMGTLALLPVSTWLHYKEGLTPSYYYLLSATLIYLTGVFGITVFGNVPLNEVLDKFNIDAATVSKIKAQRISFEIPWNRLNLVRTVATLITLVLVLLAIFKK